MGNGSTHSVRRMAVLAALCALSVCVPSTVGADPLPLTIERIHPVDDAGTTLMAGREAARVAGDPDLFKIKADLWLRNSGGSDLVVASVTTSYPGSAVSSYSFPHLTDETIPAGDVGRVRVFDGLDRQLPLPLPPTLKVKVAFVGTSETFEASWPLALYENATPSGSHLFAMAAADLPAGQYWAYGTRHIDNADAGKPSTVRDRYAYDLVVRRWDGCELERTRHGRERRSAARDQQLGLPGFRAADLRGRGRHRARLHPRHRRERAAESWAGTRTTSGSSTATRSCATPTSRTGASPRRFVLSTTASSTTWRR